MPDCRRHIRMLANAVAFLALAAAPGRTIAAAAHPGPAASAEAAASSAPPDAPAAADAPDQAPLVAGDCNRDDEVGAADVSALALRVFGLSFTDNQTCDANGDGPVDAGDLSCTVLKIFEGPNVCGVSDPVAVAPPLDLTVPTNVADSIAFLYTGDNPIQRGVPTGTITVTRAAGLRGQVRDRAGDGLSGVRVTVLDHPEYGHTFTRLDGMWDMAVNGGGWLTLHFEKSGFLEADRKIDAAWGGWEHVDDVVMIQPDPVATPIQFPAGALQVAAGSVITDTHGMRQAVLLFKPGTVATITLASGVTQTLASGNVRATEYTVGADGPDTMPAALPANSAYTYAAAFYVDEAEALGATRVAFSRPVIFYLDNFITLPISATIPMGYYDEETAVWKAADNGTVLKIVSITAGMADIDLDGDDVAESEVELAVLGIDSLERTELANRYPAGKSLWRTPVRHFSDWDPNMGGDCKDDPNCSGPGGDVNPPGLDVQPQDNQPTQCGSIIGCESQTLGEALDLVGVPYQLRYQSERTEGAIADYRLLIPLTGPNPPASVQGVRYEINVAGQFTGTRQPIAATPNRTVTFVWNGRNGFNQPMQGAPHVRVRVGYVYGLIPSPVRRFASLPYNSVQGYYCAPPYCPTSRGEVTIWRDWEGTIGGWRNTELGLGGWTFDVLHAYDATAKVLYMGDGSQRSAQTLDPVVTTFAGSGQPFYSGDSGPAASAVLARPAGMGYGPDGSLYILQAADQFVPGTSYIRRIGPDKRISTFGAYLGVWTHALAVGIGGDLFYSVEGRCCDGPHAKVLRIAPDGTVHPFAGTTYGFSGDGGPATQAKFNGFGHLGVGPDGSVYIPDPPSQRIRKVAPDGIVTTVAGISAGGFSGDNGPATQARLYYPNAVDVGPDGSLYIADTYNYRIRRVLPTGIITTFTGTGNINVVANVPRRQASIGAPSDVRVGGDGLVYILAERYVHHLLQVDGTITETVRVLAGTGGSRGDGGPASSGRFASPYSVVVDPDGTIYVSDSGDNRIRKIQNGIITTYVGQAPYAPYGAGGEARAAYLSNVVAAAFAPDGTMYAVLSNTVVRIRPDGIVVPFAGGGAARGDGGPATQAKFLSLGSVAVGPDGSVYLGDSGDFRIRKVAPNGIITTFAGGGVDTGDGIPALQASIRLNYGLAADEAGNVYFSNSDPGPNGSYNGYVRRVGSDGILSTIAGNGGGGSFGRAINARLDNVTDIAVDRSGNLYLSVAPCCQWMAHRVYRIGPDGMLREFAGGGGLYGTGGDGGPAWQATLASPSNVAVARDGTVFISTAGKVRMVTPDGIIRTLAGTGVGSAWDDNSDEGGPAPNARLGAYGAGGFVDLAVGPDGALYMVEGGRNRIRKVASPVAGLGVTEQLVASADGSEVYVFSADGRHRRTLNALTGAVLLQFSYDGDNRLVGITDADGNVTSVQRDAEGLPLSITGPYGQVTSLQMDANDRLAQVTNPAGETVQLTNTALGLLTSMTDPRGNVHTYQYDSAGRLVRDTDPAGGFKELTRSPSSQAENYSVSLATALGRTTVYNGARTSQDATTKTVTAPNGLSSTSTSNADGSSSSTGPDGMVASQSTAGDPRFGMQAPVAKTQNVTTPGGRQLSVTRSRSVTLSELRNPFSANPLVETTVVNGRSAKSSYYAATRVFTDTSPMGRTATAFIDTLGRPTWAEAPGIEPLEYTYDARGRLVSATQGGGLDERTLGLAYNAQGYLASVTDPLGRIASFAYDAAGRVTSQTLPDGRVIGFGYDAGGNNTRVTPPGRPDHTFTYNAVDLTASYNPPDLGPGSEATTYTYNLDKQLTNIARPDGRSVALGYDSAGRMSSVAIQRGTVALSYSPTAGNLTSVTAPGGIGLAYTYDGSLATNESLTGPVAGGTGYTYDNDFRVTSQTVNGANSVSMSYDNDSLLTQVGGLVLNRDAQNGLLTGTTHGSVADHWRYNGFAEPISYTAKTGGTPLYDVQYDRDSLGRITTKTETITATTSIYDYTYDTAGRLTQVELNGSPVEAYTYDANSNRLTFTGPGGTVVGTYDAQDRMLTYGGATYAYNINGELMSKSKGAQVTSYDYDELGNLTHVALPSGTAIDYLIDGRNRCIGKKVNGALVQGFLWGGQLRPVAELDGAGALVSRFVYATHVNVPDYMVKGGVTYRIVTDQVGSVRLVVNAATGAVAQRMDYDAFGRVLADTNPGWQPFGFAGGLYDGDTGLVRFGARDYDTEGGRWGAKDPIGFGGDDINLYRYVASDPLNLGDPTGWYTIDAPDEIGEAAIVATEYWSDRSIDPNNAWYETAFYFTMGSLAVLRTPELRDTTATVLSLGLACSSGVQSGAEIKFGNNVRIAPFGNRTGNKFGELPHYHRRGIGSGGKTQSGQGIGRHRPWERKQGDKSILDRF